MSILKKIFGFTSHPAVPRVPLYERTLAVGGEMLDLFLQPARTAHIGVDLQQGYCTPCLPLYYLNEDEKNYYRRTERMLSHIFGFAAELQENGIRSHWLRHMVDFKADFFADKIAHGDHRRHSKTLVEFARNAQDMVLDVDPSRIVEKALTSGFHGTILKDKLTQENTKYLLITGGRRRICVLQTALGALKEGFIPFIVEDRTLADDYELTPEARNEYCEMLSDEGIFLVSAAQVGKCLARTVVIRQPEGAFLP